MRLSKNIKREKKMGTTRYNKEIFKREFAKAFNAAVYNTSSKKAKRFRSAFKTEQVEFLENEFSGYPYIGPERRKEVAEILHISERAIKIWFQNRRMKRKKEESNNEADSDMEVDESSHNERSLQSPNNTSLPILSIPSRPNSTKVEGKTLRKPKHAYKDVYFNDNIRHSISKEDICKVKDNSLRSTTTTMKTDLGALRKHKTKKCDFGFEEKMKVDLFSNTDIFFSPVSPVSSPELQKFDYPFISLPPAVPYDLSFKPADVSEKAKPDPKCAEVNFNPEIPFHLKEYFMPPYITQGNMIWKPVNMAPFIAPAPIPNLQICNQDPTAQNLNNVMKCNCGCHKSYVTSMMVQNNPNNVQYVLTTVPVPNINPKF